MPKNRFSHTRSWIKKIGLVTLPLCLIMTQVLYAKEEAWSEQASEDQFIEESTQLEVNEESEDLQTSFDQSSAMQIVKLTEAQIQNYVPQININAPAKTLGTKDVELLIQGIEELETRSTLSRN